jgi:hypothetical protein
MALTKVTRNLLSTGIDDQSTSTAITIDSSSNVGIGTSSPTTNSGFGTPLLEVRGSSGGSLLSTNSTTGGEGVVTTRDTGINISMSGSATASTGNNIVFRTGNTNSDYNSTERMRIDSSGRVIVTSASTSTSNGYLYLKGNTTNFSLVVADSVGSNFYPATFRNNSNTEVGSISATQSATSYNTSSDYRLKENVVEMDGAIDRVKLLQPKRFNFIATPEDTVDGFLAHEVQDIVPEAIHGVKDEVDEDGNAVYQGIDQSKLVPLLTKAIQEQQTIIEDLKARIETLENA